MKYRKTDSGFVQGVSKEILNHGVVKRRGGGMNGAKRCRDFLLSEVVRTMNGMGHGILAGDLEWTLD